ncbi:ABC transporter permease [Nocardia sp. CS682]|uniref:PhnE/PtxC family ABC transporter permease n=1 Tax=Nocardia sp. CS682 TaxID=1047172 RepID=UPI00198103E8|nr:ABC transporter permease subunit [Nocardia sp. CS682]
MILPGGGAAFVEFFGTALHPELDQKFLVLTLIAALTTLAYAVLGTLLSTVIGIVGGVLASQAWWMSGVRGRARRSKAGWAVARLVLAVPRGIHEVVWALFFLLVFGLNPMVAVLAIGIPFGAVTAKVFSELLDEAPRRPYEALQAAGVRKLPAMLYGLVPLALPDLVSYSFYRFDCAIRSAAILGIVGAGGLGYELVLSFQTLRYHEIWTLLYALIALNAAAEVWSGWVRRRHNGPSHDPVLIGSLLVGILLAVLSIWWIGLDVRVLGDSGNWHRAVTVLGDAWSPDLGPGGIGNLIELTAVTLAMSVLAMVFAFFTGVLLAFPAARLSQLGRRTNGGLVRRAGRAASMVAVRIILVVLRAIPPPVWALLFLFVCYPGIVPGALALGVYTAGVLGRLMAEAAENLDGRPLRALRAQGATEAQVFSYGVVPAVASRFVAFGLYRWEVTIRETIVVGVVGAGGLGLLLDHRLHAFDYRGAFAAMLALAVLTIVVDFASAFARRSIR